MHIKGWFAKSTDGVSLEVSWFCISHWKCRVNAGPCQPEKTADISRRHHRFLRAKWRLGNDCRRCHYVEPRGKFSSANQKHHPDLSLVWNFCNRFSDVISQGNQWWRPEMWKGHACYLLAWLKLSYLHSLHGWGIIPLSMVFFFSASVGNSWNLQVAELTDLDSVMHWHGSLESAATTLRSWYTHARC